MKILVGYTHTAGGADALRLGTQLAQAFDAPLEIAMVVTGDAGGLRHVRDTAAGWLAEALAAVPEGVAASTHLEFAESAAAGLLGASRNLGTTLIVVGGRERSGSVSNALLHASRVPVAVAPAGHADADPAPLRRVTAAVGLRPGAEAVMRAGVLSAQRAGADLRVLSLVTLDARALGSEAEGEALAAAHGDRVRAFVREVSPDGLAPEVAVAAGRRIEDAVRRVEWEDGEIVLVGSSRLASLGRTFLGSTAGKMLRALPVPLVIVPRDMEPTFEDKEPTS
ncbi:universal stress protein [Zhihengliuella halotolerans]|uniref:Universal stress protein family protein n=1 Tax=Zhihengliuella halotolerans TaxID=370736 RepID=A0A4Q8AFV6_9MICC|nr:universal stress protein [Zhihengliuella halotolerans]RZU63237.1 universal stress protein family protein [Zhihengliuella halotolerans]